MGCQVIPAGPVDAGKLSQVIAEAFHGLAPARWLIGNPHGRREIFPRYFRIFVEHAMTRGTVHTTPERTAAALWLPIGPDGPIPPEGYSARLAEATGPWVRRFMAFDAELDRHHPAGISHHHLAILAVHPDVQHQGTGAALLRAYHSMLDDVGIPAYLEASEPGTRVWYLRHGYTDHGPSIQLPDGPVMFPMWRQPRQPADVGAGP
jgi:GNAT superfamily N-acetyltransferase